MEFEKSACEIKWKDREKLALFFLHEDQSMNYFYFNLEYIMCFIFFHLIQNV